MPHPEFDANSRLALFADFDGTLVEMAPRPDEVVASPGLVAGLIALDERLGHAFALVSGRSIAVLDQFLTPALFAAAGAHGSERRRADGGLVPPPPNLIAGAGRLYERLQPLASGEPRLVLERKAASVALHYRQAPELGALCRATAEAAVRDEPGFAFIDGKMVVELRPALLDKGVAIAAFMAEPPFAGRLPVFVGDDRTDEDGFAVVQRLGGFGIKVGPGPTAAELRLADVAAVSRLLAGLAGQSGHPGPDAVAALIEEESLRR
jgi:trehalose 6-phosphate phosphatase